MSSHINLIRKNLRYLCSFFIGEITLQLLLIFKSVFIVRTLLPYQYAQYSLFVSITSTFIVLGSGTFAGGNLLKFIFDCKSTKQKIGILTFSVFKIYRYFIFASAPIIAGFLAYSLFKINSSLLTILALSLLSVLYVATQIYTAIHRIFLIAGKKLDILNNNMNLAEAAKLIPILILRNVISFGSLGLCLLFSCIDVIQARSLSKACDLHKIFDLYESKKILSRFKSLISPIVPGLLFSTVQSQLPVFIAVAFGNVQTVAEVGALAKLSLVYSFLNAFNHKVLSPFVASSNRINLKSRYFAACSLVLFMSVSILTLCLSFPSYILNILGEDYNNIDAYNWIIILGSLDYINTSLWAFNSSQHWIYKWMPLLSIPGTILIQILFVCMNSMADPVSIFKMMTYASVFILFNRFLVSFVGFKRLQACANF